MSRKKIIAICGSTRKNSTNEMILRGIASTYSHIFDVTIFNTIDTLPHFNPDLENTKPQIVVDFLKKLEESDGVLFCTPEYVFSLPGSLKNAIEWTIPTTVLLNKPVAIIVASGLGEKAFESLILIMNTVGAKIGSSATLLIQGLRNKIDGQGHPIGDELKSKMDQLIESFRQSMA